jgi:hypothetical protein
MAAAGGKQLHPFRTPAKAQLQVCRSPYPVRSKNRADHYCGKSPFFEWELEAFDGKEQIAQIVSDTLSQLFLAA